MNCLRGWFRKVFVASKTEESQQSSPMQVCLCENYHPWIRKAKELMQLGFIKCPDQDPWFVRILVTGQGIL